MSSLLIIIIYSWFAGISAFLGGFIAWLVGEAKIEAKRELAHFMIAFGGGILLSSITFTLIPEGMKFLSTFWLITTFCLGGISFYILDNKITIKYGNKSQFISMLLDFIPESIALGAIFIHDTKMGILLAFFIAAQNLPEGFNAFGEFLPKGKKKHKNVFLTLFAISFLGPIFATIGYFLLQDKPIITAGLMCFSAGGILYLIFQDIAPKSTMKKHRILPLGAVLGFAIGMIGKQLIG